MAAAACAIPAPARRVRGQISSPPPPHRHCWGSLRVRGRLGPTASNSSAPEDNPARLPVGGGPGSAYQSGADVWLAPPAPALLGAAWVGNRSHAALGQRRGSPSGCNGGSPSSPAADSSTGLPASGGGSGATGAAAAAGTPTTGRERPRAPVTGRGPARAARCRAAGAAWASGRRRRGMGGGVTASGAARLRRISIFGWLRAGPGANSDPALVAGGSASAPAPDGGGGGLSAARPGVRRRRGEPNLAPAGHQERQRSPSESLPPSPSLRVVPPSPPPPVLPSPFLFSPTLLVPPSSPPARLTPSPARRQHRRDPQRIPPHTGTASHCRHPKHSAAHWHRRTPPHTHRALPHSGRGGAHRGTHRRTPQHTAVHHQTSHTVCSTPQHATAAQLSPSGITAQLRTPNLAALIRGKTRALEH